MLILAINPLSGRGHARKRALVAKKHFTELGIPVKLVEGESLVDFRHKFLRDLGHEPVSGVVAFGGDGFIHEIIQHIVPREIPLGVIPCGTGNDFARSIGVHRLSLTQQLDLIVHNDAQPIDLGIRTDFHPPTVTWSIGNRDQGRFNIEVIFIQSDSITVSL